MEERVNACESASPAFDNDISMPARRTFRGEAWRHLKENRAALAGMVVILILTLGAILAPLIAPYDPIQPDASALLKPPSTVHPFGTDRMGRDILSRVLYGARISLTVGFLSMSLALLAGVPTGLISAYVGGRTDDILQRLTDITMSLPNLVFAIAIVAALGPSMLGTLIAITISAIPSYVRLTRSMILTIKERDFVLAARALGVPPVRILIFHLLPNALGPIVVQGTLMLGGAILMESGLSFLGLGAQPPTPSWGGMIAEGREFIYSGPHLITVPGLFIMITVLSINLLGDGLRDAMDPRLHGR